MRIQTRLCQEHYKLLVVGGGASGCAVASKFLRILQPNDVAIIEPSMKHYYQPGLTFVGSGILKLDDIVREEADVIPKKAKWLKDSVAEFYPQQNKVELTNSSSISYDYLLIAAGLQLRYDLISGLTEDVLLNAPGICSIYNPLYATKVFQEAKKLESGNAIFTLPNTPIKCAGAPQKILYLTEELLRKNGKRHQTQFIYNTSLGQCFAVTKYSESLMKIVKSRDIQINVRHNLIKVDSVNQKATFELLNNDAQPTGETKDYDYSFLHVAPPCSPIKALRETKANGLTDASGWVLVNSETLRSNNYPNIFAIGDCAGLPNSKTAAAISSQLKTLSKNLQSVLSGKEPTAKYDGYTSCPLVVDRGHVILAEFNGQGLLETFPYDQSKPSRFAYFLKRYLMQPLYWHFLINGLWNGPAVFRKIFAPFKLK